MTTTQSTDSRPPRRRRGRRVALFVALGVAGLVIAVVVALLIPGVRGLVLREALRRADGALPGHLAVEHASWPGPGTIALEGIAWTDSADTLARAARVRVGVGLGALFRRDLDVTTLEVAGACANVPAITARFPSAPDTAAASGNPPSFPRPGAIRGVPSMRLRHVDVGIDSIVVSPGDVLAGIAVAARADLLHGHDPTAAITRLTAHGRARAWGIERMQVEVDLARGVVDGHIAARLSPHEPLFVALSSDRADRAVLTVTRREGATPPGDVGARITLDIERQGFAVERVHVDADVHTPGVSDLTADPALADRLAGVPPLEGVTGNVTATVTLSPALAADGVIVLERNAWLGGARVEAAYRNGVTEVSSARVDLDGLALRAAGRVTPDSLTGRADVDVTGGAWMRALRPDAVPPTFLDANPITARLSARGELPVERLTLDLLLSTVGYHAGLGAVVDVRDGVDAALSPLVVHRSTIRNTPPVPANPGRVRLTPDGSLRAENVRITGDAGEIRADATLDASHSGAVRVRARWPELPRLLRSTLNISPAAADSLARSWRRDGPFSVDARATLGRRIDAHVALDLPGPRTLAPLLPVGAGVDDLGNIAGTIDAAVSTGDGPAAVDATADLGATAWIDTARARVSVRGGAMRVDTVVVAIDSLAARGSGEAVGDSLDVALSLRIDGVEFLRRFARGMPKLQLRTVARIHGSSTSPFIEADLDGAVAGTHVAGRARLGPHGAHIRLNAPDGVVTPQAVFDVAEVTLAANHPGPSPLPAAVRVRLEGEGVSFYQTATVADTPATSVDTDTLRLSLGGRDLATRRSFAVRARAGGGIVVDGLDLSGSLGRVRVDADLGPDSAAVDADISVQMPDKPESLSLPANYWPEALEATVQARGHGVATDSLHAVVHVDGITLADGRRPDIRVRAETQGDDVTLDVTVSDGDTSLVDADARVPGTVTLWPPAFTPGDGDAHVKLRARGVPVSPPGRSRVMRVGADADLSGTVDAPAGSLSVVVDFPGWPKLESYRARFAGNVHTDSGGDRASAQFTLVRAGARRLTAGVDYTGEIALEPPFLSAGEGSRVSVHAHSEPLSLDEFDALLPPDIGLGGTLAIDLDADGPPRNPKLDGTLTVKDAEVSVRQRLRLVSNGTIRLGGSVKDPSAKGEVTIENGLIRIPDTPKELLPTSGTARLVEGGTLPTDTTTTEAPPTRGAEPVRGSIDITVTIPGALWIRGRGIDIELAGKLQIRQENRYPVLTGQLRAVRGTLMLLGRSFQLERGTVVFYGDDAVDPSLDVRLSTTIDNTQFYVTITGTASKPEISLTSDPAMEEGDIMSYLVFGRPLGSLDQDQRSLVQTRAAEIAAAMGAARLQEELRSQLGIDMVAIQAASSDNQSSALVVGKYINPRLLVKYERLLEEQAAQFINIEYFLTRRLKIDTLYGRQDQQGIEIEWSNEY